MEKYDNQMGFREFLKMKNAEADAKPRKIGWLSWMILLLAAYLIFFYPRRKDDVAPTPAEVPAVDISAVPKREISGGKFGFSVQGLRIYDIALYDYDANLKSPGSEDAKADPVRLLANPNEFVEVEIRANGAEAPTADTLWVEVADSEKALLHKGKSGVQFKRHISVSDDYVITVKDEIKNESKQAISVSQYSRIVRAGDEKKSRFAVHVGAIACVNGDIEKESWDDLAKKPKGYLVGEGQFPFAGFTDQYWQVIAASKQPGGKTVELQRRAGGMYQAEIAPKYIDVAPGASVEISTEIFAGPKTLEVLRSAAAKIPNIDRTLDYGTFGFLSRPFLWTLGQLHDLIPNWGVAIMLLTIIIRILMLPLTKKSYKSMAAMQKLQPEIQRVQKLYADDKMRMQQEIMFLYKTHKVNPMSSIGIMFLQIPIFFALYKALLIAVPLRHAGFLWLADLTAMDPYFILPVLMTATMWLQNRMQKQAADTPGAAVLKWMPLMFGAMFAFMPSGLVLYWTVSGIVGLIQTWIMKRRKN